MEFKLIVELDTNKQSGVQQLPPQEQPEPLSISEPRQVKADKADKWDWICVALTILCLWQIASPSPTVLRKTQRSPTTQPTLKAAPLKYTGKPIFPLGGKTLATARITDLPGSPRPNNRIHAGIDLAAYQDDVVAVLPGTIVELKPDSGVGGIIGIDSNWNGKKVKLRYVHLEREPLRSFSLGQKVQAGQKLSYIKSNFPGSSGSHLHLEVYINGELQWRPQDFLKQAVVNR